MSVFRIKEIIERGIFGRTKIYSDIAAGRLVTHKVGGSRMVLESDWNDYLRGVSREASGA